MQILTAKAMRIVKSMREKGATWDQITTSLYLKGVKTKYGTPYKPGSVRTLASEFNTDRDFKIKLGRRR